VTGLVDAVVDGKTGLLVPAKNVGELGQALLQAY
jgi:glycosyltransferase involved in cell wall biosynthesis